jgi:orotate phosphoribosyltransferase
VPLAVATAIALAESGHDAGFAFDRKEAKDHGEGGIFVGARPREGQSVVIVDDVITSGSSIEHSASLLQSTASVRIVGVVIAVDRQERGRVKTTLEELSDRLGAPVLPVVSIRQVVDHWIERGMLIEDERARIQDYLDRHGAPGST